MKSRAIFTPAFFPWRCTSSWSPISSLRPQLVITETPKTGNDMWRATITSGTVDIPAASPPIALK